MSKSKMDLSNFPKIRNREEARALKKFLLNLEKQMKRQEI